MGVGKAKGLVSIELSLFTADLNLTGSQGLQHSSCVTHNCSVLHQ